MGSSRPLTVASVPQGCPKKEPLIRTTIVSRKVYPQIVFTFSGHKLAGYW